jgi:SPP1 family holin
MEKIKPDTIIRTIVLALALLNQCLTIAGKQVLPIEDETINLLITNGFTIVTAVWAWWKNNSFTREAIAADVVMRQAKAKGE